MSLAGMTVVVLGGSSGIGLATARGAHREKARVVITGRSQHRLDAAKRELDPDVLAVPLDVADETGTRALFERLERVDHVFITAGAISFGRGLAPDTAALRPALDTRFWGALYAAKYAAPKMARGGSITFMSGTAAVRPLPGASVATASCGAVEAFARALALDLAPIRVNVIQPGLIDTPLIGELMGDRREAMIAQEAARLPVGRVGKPEDVADAVLFLMRNGYVTGITLTIDGGRLLL
jgi:NAD(P)-dependent dehydrogenase (short-subunit alcohol dehydrogenase family)